MNLFRRVAHHMRWGAPKILPVFSLLLISTTLLAQSGPHDLHAYFSPNGGCTDAVVSALQVAKKTVLVQAYSFTSVRIAKALVDAKKRGLDVRVILGNRLLTPMQAAEDHLLIFEGASAGRYPQRSRPSEQHHKNRQMASALWVAEITGRGLRWPCGYSPQRGCAREAALPAAHSSSNGLYAI